MKKKVLTQIAFGADADCTLNPDLFKMMEYARSNGVIPNITVADITEETAQKLANVCGAVAVSWYGYHTEKDFCYDSIDRLVKASANNEVPMAINMHFMLSKETLPYIDELINDIKTDERLSGLNAVVFLSLKQKGRGKNYEGCTVPEFKTVVNRMLDNNIGFGFDSCSQPKFIASIKGSPKEKEFAQISQSCESLSESTYINEKGILVPCSFMEDMPWNSLDYNDSKGWDLLSDEITNPIDFVNKIWNSKRNKCIIYNSI